MARRVAAVLTLVSAGVAAIALSGCTIQDQVWANPMPELATLDRTPEMVGNGYSMSYNLNRLQILGDLGRVMYTDRASRLSPLPLR
jgi:hypothetical protein